MRNERQKDIGHSNSGTKCGKSKLLQMMEILWLTIMMITMVLLPTTNNRNGYQIHATTDILLLLSVDLANIIITITSIRTLATPTYFQYADRHKFKSVKYTKCKQKQTKQLRCQYHKQNQQQQQLNQVQEQEANLQRLQQSLYKYRYKNAVAIPEYRLVLALKPTIIIHIIMVPKLRKINTNNNTSNNINIINNNFCDNFLMRFKPVSNLIIEIDASSDFAYCVKDVKTNIHLSILANNNGDSIANGYCLCLDNQNSATIYHRFCQQKQQQCRWQQLLEMMLCHHFVYTQIFSYYALIYSNKSIYCQHLHCSNSAMSMARMDLLQINVCIVVRRNGSKRIVGYLTMTTDRFKKVNKNQRSIERFTIPWTATAKMSTTSTSATTTTTKCANFSTIINFLSVLLTYGALIVLKQQCEQQKKIKEKRNCVDDEQIVFAKRKLKPTENASNNVPYETLASSKPISTSSTTFSAKEILLETSFQTLNKICATTTNSAFWQSNRYNNWYNSRNNNSSLCNIWNCLNVLSTMKPSATSSSLLLKKHIFLLVIAFLTCVPISVTTATMHNMKYSTNLVKTKYGQLRGIVVRSDPSVEAYLGVPYATPPVGSLR